MSVFLSVSPHSALCAYTCCVAPGSSFFDMYTCRYSLQHSQHHSYHSYHGQLYWFAARFIPFVLKALFMLKELHDKPVTAQKLCMQHVQCLQALKLCQAAP